MRQLRVRDDRTSPTARTATGSVRYWIGLAEHREELERLGLQVSAADAATITNAPLTVALDVLVAAHEHAGHSVKESARILEVDEATIRRRRVAARETLANPVLLTRPPAPKTLEQRIEEKIDRTDGCWLWTASTSAEGYARVNADSTHGGVLLVHRWMYERHVGPIPAGLHIDHLCRVRHCVNPAHLEPVTNRENTLRGVAPTVLIHKSGLCAQGHELIRHDHPSGTRWRCRECYARRAREVYRRKHQPAAQTG